MKAESQGRMVSSVKKSSVGFLAVTGILSAIAYILMWIEFPIPFLIPPFIKFDFSDFPALIAAFALGPVSGIWWSSLRMFCTASAPDPSAWENFPTLSLGQVLQVPQDLFIRKTRARRGQSWPPLLAQW